MSEAISRLNSALEGRYSIERELGEGGMAGVDLVEQSGHRTTANCQVPYILPLFDAGEASAYLL